MKPTIPEVIPLIRWYYALPGHSNGGSLHVVLEDDNNRQCDIDWCIDFAREQGDIAGVWLGTTLAEMSRSQRHRLATRYYFYPEVAA